MKRFASVSFVTLASLASNAHAQEPLVGMYTGNMVVSTTNGPRTIAVELTIHEVDNGGLVKATAKRYTKDFCNAKFGLEGRFEGDVLMLKPTPGGVMGCAIDMNMTQDGKTLNGTSGDGTPIKLSR
jgi:hypothetical protein